MYTSLLFMVLLVPASFAVKCHLCTDPNGDCTSKQPCEGAWCTQQIVHSAENTLVSKGCSPTNALPSQHDDCLKTPPLGGRENVNCFCNSSDFCNTQDFVKKNFPKALEFSIGAGGAPAGGDKGAAAGGEISCIECVSPKGDCSTGTCKGSWCVAKIVKNDKIGTLVVTKSCEKENPIDKTTDTCISATTPDSTNIICTCKGGNNCNNKDNLDQMYAKTANGANIFGGKGGAPVPTGATGGKAEPEPNAEPNAKNGTKPASEPEPTGNNNGTQAEPEPNQIKTNTVVGGAPNNTLAAEPEPKSSRPEPEKVPTPERNATRKITGETESRKSPDSAAGSVLFGLISIAVPLAVAFC